ncbi:helix-turn-helix domain-containing protein [Celerinatantimonas yamalensis]|uniref:Helix-turn-helix domain-containing protein n=1 Tax=Celerinatantimonas yamalensis TaxID=559956 RepID=A0ABW9G5V3_9GAMM
MTICAEVRAPQLVYPEHSHDFHELVIITKGAGQHILNDVPTNLTQNYICYISPRDRHLYEQVDHLYLTNILYKKNILSYSPLLKHVLPKDGNDQAGWYICSETMKRVSILLSEIEQESQQPSVDSRIMTEALFQQLVVAISRGRLTAKSNDLVDNAILKIIDWIQTNYVENICMNDISDRFQISSRTLSRKIKQMTNLSFNNYVHRVRINHAINLLKYSDASITDIAFEVGYQDSNYFSTKFKRFTNKTPSEFR